MNVAPKLLCALGLTACLGLTASRAHAFKEPGHRAIEKAAYLELLSTEEGRAVLETLVRAGVLRAPHRPYPEPSRIDPEFAGHAVHGLALDTHLPDHLLDRQFDKDLQCFHFNARGSHMTEVPGQIHGVPRGLVEHAYVECLGVADALLRSVLFEPRESSTRSVDVYALMHVIEDSYADSHVARAPGQGYKIVYLKPWTLRTWWTYFVTRPGGSGATLREHFSHSHHGTLESRDSGYLVGRWDTEGCLTCSGPAGDEYRARVRRCLEVAAPSYGREVTLTDLEGPEVVPPECLSDRALEAKSAIADLLRLVAKHVACVDPPHCADEREAPVRVAPGFAEDWLAYRKRYLLHVDARLTERMEIWEACGGGACPDVRGDLLYPATKLAPVQFRTAGVGLSTELTVGTPLWLGFEAFVASNAGAHAKIGPTDFLGYAIQLRVPLENELGERPIGLGLDLGPTLPVPISELASKEATVVALYLGVRGRVAYTAQSVFEDETRHVFGAGFGGVSADFVVANRVWFGLDFPRVMWSYDSWDRSWERTMTWNFNGGLAIDAF